MIQSYSFGRIEINGQKYTSDVIIFPDRVESNWWRKEGHSLHEEDIQGILEKKPDILVVGTGNSGLMTVPSKTRERIESAGIRLVVEPTEEACKTFNELIKRKKVVAALHLTC